MSQAQAENLAKQAHPDGFNPDKDGCELVGTKSGTEYAFLLFNKAGRAAKHMGCGALYLVNLKTEEVDVLSVGQYPQVAEDYVDSPYNQQRLAQDATQAT